MTNPQPWWLTWAVAEVAAAILPLFCHSESQRDKNARACIVNWCKTGSYQSTVRGLNTDPFTDPDHRAINEGMQVLEYGGLLMRYHDTDKCFVGLTRLGVHALQTNTVRQHLGLSDTPPTAESGYPSG
jgi:hypothetical protein